MEHFGMAGLSRTCIIHVGRIIKTILFKKNKFHHCLTEHFTAGDDHILLCMYGENDC